MLRLATVVLLALFLAACGMNRTDRALGLITDTDGTLLSTTDVNVRRVHQNQTVEDLRKAADQPAAAVTVNVAELPVHGHDADDFPYWAYPAATVTIGVPADFPLDQAAIVAIANDQFEPKLLPPQRTVAERLQVTVERLPIAAAPVAAPAAASAPAAEATDPAAPAAPKQPASQTYVVQAGDTLAAISAAFYGSSQHWRRIQDANPGLSPELEPGTTLLIPPAP